MDQQKQPATPDTKTGTVVQSTQTQQQKDNLKGQDNKQANPANGNQTPLKEGNAPAKGDQKAL